MKTLYVSLLCCLACVCAPAQAPATLSLSQLKCRQLALEHSEDLQQAENRLRQAELDRKIATTAYFPNIAGSATGAYMLPDMDVMGMELRMRGTYMAGITLTQPVYAGGKITAGRRLAKIGEEAAAEQLQLARMDVIAEADNAYWTYVAVGQKVAMLQSLQSQMDTLRLQVGTAVSAGMATDNDLLRIEAKRSEILYQLQRVQNGLELCRMSLCRLIGAEFDTEIEVSSTIGDISEPSPKLPASIKNRPELSLLEKQVAAGRQQVRMERADMLPQIGLSLGYTYYGNIKLHSMMDVGNGMMMPIDHEFRDGIGLAMLAVKIPICHWGEKTKQVKKAKYALNNAELDLQKSSRLLSIEVQQAIRNLQDGYLLVQTAELGVQQSNENLRVMQNRYAAAMATLTDLLDAQSQWQQAQSNLIEAQTQYKIHETVYLRATGMLF
ncbi:MAG: TolC family protein [Bacteroides sp.]|nr:TolC family protein [Bacteroides sp.]